MQGLIDGVAGVESIALVWAFAVSVVLHQSEEWNVNTFERRHFSEVPEFATDRSARGFILLYSIAALLIASAATLAGHEAAPWVVLPAVFFMLTNAAQHAYWSIRFRSYAPGTITALCLILPIGAALIVRAAADERVPVAYPAILAIVSAVVFVQTMLAGDRMTGSVRSAYAAGSWIARHLPG